MVPPRPVLDAVAAWEGASPGLAALPASRTDQRHLTVRFLGPVPDQDALVAELRTRLAAVPAFPAGLGGFGGFPRRTRAGVLWLGLRTGRDGMAGLARACDEARAALGASVVSEPFRAHLTLARARRPLDVRSLGVAPASAVGPVWTVAEALLVESRLGALGADHRTVDRFPLAQPDPAR